MLRCNIWYNDKWTAWLSAACIIPPVSSEMQYRYGEIKAILCRDSEIPLRSESFQSTERLNDPNGDFGFACYLSPNLLK